MKARIILTFIVVFISLNAFSQAKTRRLPSIINHPSLNLYAPYVSADGNALLFISDYGQDGALIVNYTSREVDWSEPAEIPKHINTRLNFLRGYSLSSDGKKMYLTSAKSPVVGGYDIFVSELKGTTWTQPENLMSPINSKTNDGCASVTADGNTMFFMRCNKMDQNKADGCKIFRTKKKPNGQWEEPVELPSNINTGNSQTPRIMADGETLIFSSNQMPRGKGGMDLYLTRFVNGTWSAPVALDFVNTEKDDQYVSVSALGRYLLKESPGPKKNSELVEYLIPDELRPKGLMKVEGKVTDVNDAVIPAYISVIDLITNKRVYNGRPAADGSFFLYLQEGSQYELAVDPEDSNLSFFTKAFDLTSDKISQKERVNVTLKSPATGDEIVLESVRFKPHSTVIEPAGEEEIKRLARLIKANPTVTFEIQVLLQGYEEDIERSGPDLTEVAIDSIHTQIDGADTVIVKMHYHNNRSVQQAEIIGGYLLANGVSEKNLRYFGNAIPATDPESKKLTVKAVVVSNESRTRRLRD